LEFYLGGERLQPDEGGCYYVNVNLPHRVVIDAEVNDWVHALFRRGAWGYGPALVTAHV